MKTRITIDAAIIFSLFALFLLARELYDMRTKINATFAWAQEAHCRVFPERCQSSQKGEVK